MLGYFAVLCPSAGRDTFISSYNPSAARKLQITCINILQVAF